MQADPARSFDPDHARILVVGPMAGGKTTLVHSLCHGEGAGPAGARLRPPPTVGCNVDVKLLERGQTARSIEFWDVGGNPDAALARGMFFEDSEAAGVLLVYDASNPRSLRELRTWVDELASSGIRTLGGGGGAASHRGVRYSEPEGLADLEGGSRASAAGAVGGAVPFLVVGAKGDVATDDGGVRREGARLASELGARHVAVCEGNEEPFESFFGEVFRHHSGRETLGDGGVRGWEERGGDEGDTYFPSAAAEAAFSASQRHEREYYGSAASGSLRRTGSARAAPRADSFEAGTGGSKGAGPAGDGARLVWPAQRASSSAAYRSRGKQS